MNKRFSLVFVLALVFVLTAATAVMAAPEGDGISNNLELQVTVKEVVGEGKIEVNDDLASLTTEGLWDVFSVSTVPPEGYEGFVKGKVTVTNDNTGEFKLEYLEQNPESSDYGKFLSMTFNNNEAYFGPSTGFPWLPISDSTFRVTWLTDGDYEFTLSIVGGENFNDVLASSTVEVKVTEGRAVALTHGIDDNLGSGAISTTVNKNATMDYKVSAQLEEGVSHVDGTLYICDVQKEAGENDWSAASNGDFEIIKVDGNENTQGINETFTVKGDVLRGYWGPDTGFTLEEQKDTTMTVKFNNAGTYKVQVYAIQVAPVESI